MKISLVVPCYNEEVALPVFYETVRNYKGFRDYEVEIVFVNDGSKDGTEQVMTDYANRDALVKVYSFTRNFGKEAALFCGLEHATGDAVIPMDVDLQDPVEVAGQLLIEWEKGADVVLAKRCDRSEDNFFKRLTAKWFYKLHNRMSNPKIEENVGDFRLMNREVVDNIIALPERNLFMKGLLSWVGGRKIAVVQYKRQPRAAGNTKFNGWKLWNLALEGITGFSTVPLHIWSYFGGLVAIVSFCYGFWMIVQKLVFGNPVPGYPSLMVAILFFGGVQLVGIGVLGEYIGRIYLETKHRPRYILKR